MVIDNVVSLIIEVRLGDKMRLPIILSGGGAGLEIA